MDLNSLGFLFNFKYLLSNIPTKKKKNLSLYKHCRISCYYYSHKFHLYKQ